MNNKNKTLIIVGSGFSVPFGLPITDQIHKSFNILCDTTSINERVFRLMQLYNCGDDETFKQDIVFTLKILGDNDDNVHCKDHIKLKDAIDEYIIEYSSLVHDVNREQLRQYLLSLHNIIDWVALKKICNIFKRGSEFDLVKVLTIIQKAINDNIAISVKNANSESEYVYPYQLVNALRAYKYIIFKIFKNVLRIKSKDSSVKRIYEKYLDFFVELANKNVIDIYTTSNETIRNSNFTVTTVGFLTFNWDPVLLQLMFKANQLVNIEIKNYGNPRDNKLRLYVDFGFPFPIVSLKQQSWANFSYSEEVGNITNDLTVEKPYHSKLISRVTKLFAPHGFINLRQCPRCHNPFMFFGHEAKDITCENLYHIFVADPIPCADCLQIIDVFQHKESYKNGKPDEIKCPRCEHYTYFIDSCMEIQSILKSQHTSVLQKIQYDYADFYGKAKEIFSFGYSFPDDDIVNNYFLDLMSVQYGTYNDKNFKIINYSKNEELLKSRWISLEQLNKEYLDDHINVLVNNVEKLSKDVVFNFAGFPAYLDDTIECVEEIIQQS